MQLPDKHPLLANIRIATPCTADWEKMSGDNKTRFCQDCKLSVHNLSAMTASEAEGLLKKQSNGDRLCVSFYRRADGTILTQDCPVGLKLLRMKAVRAWNKAASFVSLVIIFGFSIPSASGGNRGSSDHENLLPEKKELQKGFSKGIPLPQVKSPDAISPPKNDRDRLALAFSLWGKGQTEAALTQFKMLKNSSSLFIKNEAIRCIYRIEAEKKQQEQNVGNRLTGGAPRPDLLKDNNH